jgi:hypothetical protein
MSIGIVVLLYVAVMAAIGLAGVLAVYVGRNFHSEKYDERQQIDRGNAYRFSWLVGMVYYFCLFAYFVFHTGKSGWPLEPYLLLMIGILIQLQSFHIYCLMTHSALPLGEKPMPAIISYFFLGGMYLVQYFAQYIPEDVVGYTGADSMNLFRLLISFDFFSLAIMHLISCLWKEKE